MTVPINSGKDFKGVYDMHEKSLVLFTAGTKANDEDVVEIKNLNDKILDEKTAKFTTQNQTNLDNILNPLKANIKSFEEKVDKVYNNADNMFYKTVFTIESFVRNQKFNTLYLG